MKLHYLLTSAILPATLWSCTGSKCDTGTIHNIEIERYFDEPPFDNITGKIKIKEKFTPEFTDSSMYNAPTLCAVADGKAYLMEFDYNVPKTYLSTFSWPDGKLLGTFTRYGAGPEEYQYSFETFFTPTDGLWTVHDSNFGRYNIMQYDNDGRFVRKTVNDTIDILVHTPTGGWLAFNPHYSLEGGFHNVKQRIIREYDADWNLLAQTELNDKRMMLPGGGLPGQFISSMGNNYVTDRDTIWHYDCDSHKLVPSIAVNMGKYGYDWGAVTSWDEANRLEEPHVHTVYPVFNNRYAFVDYYKPGKDSSTNRYDIYDLRDGSLVYRWERPREEDPMRRMGLPFEIDGHTVTGWPIDYQDSEDFYVMIPAESIAEATGNDEVNPVILKISIDD